MRNSVSVSTGSPQPIPGWCQVLGHHPTLPGLLVPADVKDSPHLEYDAPRSAVLPPQQKAVPSGILPLSSTPDPRDFSFCSPPSQQSLEQAEGLATQLEPKTRRKTWRTASTNSRLHITNLLLFLVQFHSSLEYKFLKDTAVFQHLE